MGKKRLWVAGIAAVMIGVMGYLGANYYGALADIRESFIDIDTSDAYAHGEMLFQTRGCAFCHTLEAAGAFDEDGPILDGIGTRHDEAYIRQAIIDPNATLSDQCPLGPCELDIMPPFGRVLDDAQVDALVIYLSAQVES